MCTRSVRGTDPSLSTLKRAQRPAGGEHQERGAAGAAGGIAGGSDHLAAGALCGALLLPGALSLSLSLSWSLNVSLLKELGMYQLVLLLLKKGLGQWDWPLLCVSVCERAKRDVEGALSVIHRR
jgi:hypothetical protein